MAIRRVLTKEENEEFLRKKSKVVISFDDSLAMLLDDMKETLIKYDGLGLAAPQVGVLKRIVIVQVDDILYELINPTILHQEGSFTRGEGCLSLPGLYEKVTRPTLVVVKAQDRQGEYHEYTVENMTARAFCHEIDHLDGVLFIDKICKDTTPKSSKKRSK